MNQHSYSAVGQGGHFLWEEESLSVWTALWSLGLLFVWVFSAVESVPYLCLALGVAGVVAIVKQMEYSALRARFNLQALFVFAYVVLSGVSCFYAVSGTLALDDFLHLLPGFFVYLLVVLLSGRGVHAGRSAAAALSVLAALISFLSLDAVGTRWFSGTFQALTGNFTHDYGMFLGLETGVRITSILEDPNVFAGVAGLGVLLSLSLALSAIGKRERTLYLCCLVLNALGFVLVFSLGAAGFIVIAFAAFLLFAGKGNRLSATVLMVETLVVTMGGVVAVYLAVFDGSKAFSIVPLLAELFCCAALWALDRFASPRVTERFSAHPKALFTALVALALALAAYTVAALNVAGSAALAPGETLERAAYLDAGIYTVSAEADGGVQVSVTSQNETDLIMHTETALYSGAVQSASFSVPEGSKVVWFRFSAPEGGTVSAVSYAGASDGFLKLGYKLLPGFIANRLQGLRANENAVQRAEFWRDGIKLWLSHPILGNGLGSVEVGLYSVASFYYESNYVHNHYIQCLADIGVVGLVLFLGILAASARLFWKGRKRENASTLLPVLGAALVFMALQAILQVDFSTHSFLPFAFGVFALLNVVGTELPDPWPVCAPAPTRQPALRQRGKETVPMPEPVQEARPSPKEVLPRFRRLRSVLHWAYPAFGTLCALVLCLHFYGNKQLLNGTGAGDRFDRLETALKLDPLYRVNYLQTYVYFGKDSSNSLVKRNLPDRVAELAATRMNCDPNYAIEYYFSTGEMEKAVDALLDHLAYNRARHTAWQYAFDLLLNNDDGTAEFHAQAQRVVTAMDDWNAQAMEQVELTPTNKTYLASLR